MAERIYPSAKPANPNPTATTATFPATKAQTYVRPAYRPQPPPKRRRSRRGCWCCCCLWLTLFLVALLFLAAIVCGVFYVLYRPHRPTFELSSIRFSNFTVTKSNALVSKIDAKISARNPNKRIDFIYDQTDVQCFYGDVSIGSGSFRAFVLGSKNSTVMKTTIDSHSAVLESSVASDLKSKSKVSVRVVLDTKAGVKFAGIRTKKIGIKVTCDEFDLSVPKKKVNGSATSDVSCKVMLRIKIWKWTID